MTPEQQLDFLANASSDVEVCRFLADRVRRTRRQAKLSQVELAKLASIPLRTFKRFETEGHGSMRTFTKIMMALGRTRYMLMLFPQELPPKKLRIRTATARSSR
jgi:transcriptional regulator with XRE-family HTH domain